MTPILDILIYLSTVTGAGVGASVLFAHLRAWIPAPTPLQWRTGNRAQRLMWEWLHNPQRALITSNALAFLIGVAAALLVAYATSDDPLMLMYAFAVPFIQQMWYRYGRMDGSISTITERHHDAENEE